MVQSRTSILALLTDVDLVQQSSHQQMRNRHPLCSSEHKFALLWTGKAGCTVAMRWYFYQIGLFEALRAFDQSLYPHIFRYQVFMQRPDYDRNYEKLTESDWLKVKFVRNPFARCVSGYLTLCEIERANRWAEFGDLKKRLESSINRAARERFTFREYVGFLAGYDLDTGDIHIVRQATIAERDGSIGHIHLVHLERRREELLDLERRLGLTDSRAVPLWEVRTSYYASETRHLRRRLHL